MIAPQIERKKSPVLKSTENNRHKFTSIMLYYCLTRKKLISHAESILRHQTKLPPTKAIMCLLLHQFNALIKSQWHKPINRLGVQLKKKYTSHLCVFIYSRCKDAVRLLLSNDFMMGVRHIFIYWNFSHNGCAITQQLLERAFERHVSIWMYNFLHNSLPFTLFRSLSRFVISFSRHAWTCSWINATQTVTFQHAFNALKFIRKIEQSILPEIDYVCAFLWSQSQALHAVIKKSMNARLQKHTTIFPLTRTYTKWTRHVSSLNFHITR